MQAAKRMLACAANLLRANTKLGRHFVNLKNNTVYFCPFLVAFNVVEHLQTSALLML